MTRYSNGANRERRIKHRLERDGWFVIRSAGSKSPVDLFCAKRSLDGVYLDARFIQSKKTGRLSPRERDEKEDLERRLGISIEVI